MGRESHGTKLKHWRGVCCRRYRNSLKARTARKNLLNGSGNRQSRNKTGRRLKVRNHSGAVLAAAPLIHKHTSTESRDGRKCCPCFFCVYWQLRGASLTAVSLPLLQYYTHIPLSRSGSIFPLVCGGKISTPTLDKINQARFF